MKENHKIGRIAVLKDDIIIIVYFFNVGRPLQYFCEGRLIFAQILFTLTKPVCYSNKKLQY